MNASSPAEALRTWLRDARVLCGALSAEASLAFEVSEDTACCYRFLGKIRPGKPAGPEAARLGAFTLPGYRLTYHAVTRDAYEPVVTLECWGEERRPNTGGIRRAQG